MANWRAFAECKDAPNPDVFFGDRNRDKVEAMTYCKSCPVRIACLNFANQAENDGWLGYGIYGGLTARQRKDMRNERHMQVTFSGLIVEAIPRLTLR